MSTITVHVKQGSATNTLHSRNGGLLATTTEPFTSENSNKIVIKLLADYYNKSSSMIELISGERGAIKTYRILEG